MAIGNLSEDAAGCLRRIATHRSGLALGGMLVVALGGSPAWAQDKAPAAALDTSPAAEPWQVSLTPYLWAISLNGDVGVAGKSADVDVSFSDLLDDLNGAVMLDLELRKGQFALMSDTIYANLSGDGNGPDGRLNVKTTANMLLQGLAGTYRLGTWRLAELAEAGPLGVSVDPYAGIRYTYLDTELKGKLDLPDLGIDAQRTVEADKQWVDPIVGLRTIWTLGERLSMILAGDIGGTSQSSDYSWEALGVLGYRFSLFGEDNANMLAGYKVLRQKFEDGDGRSEFEWDVTMHGPVLGLTIRF
jgi:hypothetical protein